MMKKIKLMFIEDNTLCSERITFKLKTHKDIAVISESGNIENTLADIEELQPAAVLIDLELQSLKSLHVAEIIKKDFPLVKIIVMNLSQNQAGILQFVQAGTEGFIMKGASLNDFLFTIRTVVKGAAVIPPMLTNSLFTQIIECSLEEGKINLEKTADMTRREREVVHLLGNGMSNKEIGDSMKISTFTVKSHIRNIMEKLSLHTRLEIANFSYGGEP